MPSSGMCGRVVLVTTDVSEERIIRKIEAISSFETSVLTRPKRRHISEDDILHSHSRGNLKSYMNLYDSEKFRLVV
jgi:hypothetical protein